MDYSELLDPRIALREILELSRKGVLPRDAGLWASAALKSANNIFYRLKVLGQQGATAPTPVHRTLLIDIDARAQRWLATISMQDRHLSAFMPGIASRKRKRKTKAS